MSLGFKRVMSSIMAFVMMVSTLVMVNVTGVMAADSSSVNVPVVVKGTDTSITAIQNDLASYADYFEIPIGDGKDTSITSKDGTYTGSIKISNGTASVSINGVTVDGVKANSKASNNVIKGLKAGDTVVFDLLWNSDSTGTMKFAASADGFSSAKDNGKSIDFPVVDPRASYQVSVTVTKDTDLYFYNDQKIAVKYIGIKSANQNEYTVSGTINGFSGTEFTLVAADGTTKYTAKNVTTSGFTVSSATPLTAGVYTVQADGYEDTTVTLATNGENAFTFAEGITFTPVTVTTVTVMPTDTGYSFTTATAGTLTTDNSLGGAYANSAENELNVTVGESGLSFNDKSTSSVTAYLPMTEIISGTNTGTVTYSGSIKDMKGIAGKWSPLTFVDADGNTIAAIRTSSSSGTPDDTNDEDLTNKFSLAIPSGTNTYMYYETTKARNDIDSTTASDFEYTVVFDYTAKTVSLTIGDSTVTSAAFETLPAVARLQGVTRGSAETSYTLGDINIVAKSGEETPSQEGCVAMGSYDFNFTAMDSTAKTGTYKNMEYSVSEVKDDHVKLKTDHYIKFKVAQSATVTAAFTGSGGLTLNGTPMVSGTAYSLVAGQEYTIAGSSSSNCWLSSLTFAATGTENGTITGNVTFTDNEGIVSPLANAEVVFTVGGVEGSVMTDSNGNYTIPVTAAGEYTITIDATDAYDTASTTVNIGAVTDSAEASTINVTAWSETAYNVTFNVTDNTGNSNTLVIRNAATGTVVDDSTVTWTGATATAIVSLEVGSYTIELLDMTKGQITGSTSFTVSGATTVDVTVGDVTTADITGLAFGQTYTFGNSGNATQENFYISATTTGNDNVALVAANSDRLVFRIEDTAKTVTIVTSSKDTTLSVVGDATTTYSLANGTTVLDLPVGYYVINGAGGTGVKVKSISVADAPSTPIEITISGTNNTSSAVVVSVNNAAGNTAATFTAAAGEFSETVSISAGTYTLSAGSGAEITNGEEFTVSEGATAWSDVVIDVSNTITVPITMKDNSSAVTVTINGSSVRLTNGTPYNLTAERGDTITFSIGSNVASNIIGWDGIDADAYDKTNKLFTATATEKGVTFTYDSNAATSVDSTFGNATATGNLVYGNYGYGDTKGTAAGAIRAENEATLGTVSGVVTLRDYMNGYRSYDQRVILNNNTDTAVKFTADGDGYLIIDCSIGTPNVTVGGSTADATEIGTSGKVGYEVKAGSEVVITKGSTSGASYQLKSVRFQSNGNVFKYVSAETVDYNSLDKTTMSVLEGTPENGKVFAKVVGSFNEADADASTIDKFGILVVSQEQVQSAIDEASSFTPQNAMDSEGSYTFKLEEGTDLYDAVYDLAKASDPEYTFEETGDYGDGTYYMLRFIAVDPGTYYMLPYTYTSGSSTASFDKYSDTGASVDNVNELSKYAVTFTAE